MKRLNSLVTIAACLVFVQAVLAGNLYAQANRENSTLLAWRTQSLRVISESLENDDLADSHREELQARYSWLESWKPGQLAATPAARNQVPAKRIEPILKSEIATRLENELSAKELLSETEQYAFLKRQASLHAEDPAMQQLYLRWMDDDNNRRKGYLPEIEIVTLRLAQLLKAQTATGAGAKSDERASLRQLALEFVLYRRARGLAYRELPDVVEHHPIKDQSKLDKEISDAFHDLRKITGGGRTEFVLIEIRIHRRNGDYGTALELLERFGHTVSRKWYFKKRRDILKHLDWLAPYNEAAAIYAEHFPDEVALEKQKEMREEQKRIEKSQSKENEDGTVIRRRPRSHDGPILCWRYRR